MSFGSGSLKFEYIHTYIVWITWVVSGIGYEAYASCFYGVGGYDLVLKKSIRIDCNWILSDLI